MSGFISQQLAMFLRSILLGGTLGLVYDLLRALRCLGGRLWGGLLDALYCLIAGSALFLFIMAGSGELHLFILAGALGGAVLFFCLFSQMLRPLWDFWLQILLAPVGLAGGLMKKWARFCKKVFSFSRSWVTMEVKKRRGPRSPTPEEGDEAMATPPGKNAGCQKKNQRKRPNSKLTALILLVLFIGVSVQIVSLAGQIQTAKEEEAVCAARLAELEAANTRLAEDIANRDNLDLIEDIARDELGMAGPGEKVFIFSK